MYAKKMSQRDISNTIEDIYGLFSDSVIIIRKGTFKFHI